MILDIDFGILDFIQEHFSCGFLDFLMPKITFLGDAGFVWILAAVGMLLSHKYRKMGIVLAAGLLANMVIGNLILKNLVARDRPCWIRDTVHMLIAVPHDFSFPSGHTMSSFTAAAVMAHASRKFGMAAYILAFFIAFSRLYLYVHFPSDVLGGMVIGTIIGAASCFVYQKIDTSCQGKVRSHMRL